MQAGRGPVKVRQHELFLWQKSVAVMLQPSHHAVLIAGIRCATGGNSGKPVYGVV
jgi:hypothetical protein